MSSASKLLPKSGTALQCYDGIRTGSTIQFHLVVELDRIPWFPPLAFVWVTLMPWAPWLSNRMPRLAEQHPVQLVFVYDPLQSSELFQHTDIGSHYPFVQFGSSKPHVPTDVRLGRRDPETGIKALKSSLQSSAPLLVKWCHALPYVPSEPICNVL
ncbi:hypothetical protein L915_05697 [Phytophthora nicotianae]|uniref:Uncharacterized protein n=2 Tax=Phytophthora nicotianae TaxID=4792 RepID=W2H7U5_PHYNI|nr:hypothetical protein L915_05697 [Phytophthora nicotianae]ETO79377.1 hypothetical protein F444_05878 [Phytophthora nicotianae P1976]